MLDWGEQAEFYALREFLKREPHARVLAHRYRVRGGEIDWILKLPMRRETLLVFLEVKASSKRAQGLERINIRKRQAWIRAAQVFLEREAHRHRVSGVRWDLLEFDGQKWVHFPDVWSGS